MTDGGPVTNVVTVISPEWLAWLRLKGVGAKNFQDANRSSGVASSAVEALGPKLRIRHRDLTENFLQSGLMLEVFSIRATLGK
jgi:hypothetical protein